MLDRAVSADVPAKLRVTLLQALTQAAKERGVKPDGELVRVAPLLKSDNDSLRTTTARLIGAWKLEAYRADLLAAAKSAATSDGLRQAALDGLVSLGGKESKTAFDALAASKDESAAMRRRALVALAAIDLAAAAQRAAEVLALPFGGAEPVEVFEAFLQRKTVPSCSLRH